MPFAIRCDIDGVYTAGEAISRFVSCPKKNARMYIGLQAQIKTSIRLRRLP